MEKRDKVLLLVVLIIMLITINYPFLDDILTRFLDNSEYGLVERVIDGDTVEINGTSVRLLGINAAEKGEKYSKEATSFLERLVLNKTVKLIFGKDKTDLYGRKLSYLFIRRKNINLEIVKEGYANPYFPSGRDKYYKPFYDAWEDCENNMCERSLDVCAECIKLIELDYKDEIVILENICSNRCNISQWSLKDEGRKKFIFENFVLEPHKKVSIVVKESGDGNNDVLIWKRADYVWTDSGDALFLRDSDARLVLWKSY
jgi:micrococcal nuclease